MSARFTERARKVVHMANEEAQRYQHEYIGPEHVLLALLSEGWSIAAKFVDPVVVRKEVETLINTGPAAVSDAFPPTPRAKQIVENAMLEARNLGQDFVDPEHLLLGLMRGGEGACVQLLNKLGLHLEDMHEEARKLTRPLRDRPRNSFEPGDAEELRLHLTIRLRHLRESLKLTADLEAQLASLFKEVAAELFPTEGSSAAS